MTSKKTKAGRPRLYNFPTTRLMVTVPTKDAKAVREYARKKMVESLIDQEKGKGAK